MPEEDINIGRMYDHPKIPDNTNQPLTNPEPQYSSPVMAEAMRRADERDKKIAESSKMTDFHWNIRFNI